jgi:hypothetical protein
VPNDDFWISLLYDHSAIDRPAMISPSMQQLCAENAHKLPHQKDSNSKHII